MADTLGSPVSDPASSKLSFYVLKNHTNHNHKTPMMLLPLAVVEREVNSWKEMNESKANMKLKA